MKLYPLQFNPILKSKVWGGSALTQRYGRAIPETEEGEPPMDPNMVGESWDLSDTEGNDSEIVNGFLAGNTLAEVLETYMGELVGDNIFDWFRNQFPLLIKILNVEDRLSVQVHPDDEIAFERYDCYGKDEFWYVNEASEDACIHVGFKRDVTVEEFYHKCLDGTVADLLNCFHPKKGDCFLIKAGTVHSCGGGLVITEIQEPSDATFRLYDWGRENDPSTRRETHLEEAIDIIDYSRYDESCHIEHAGAGTVVDTRHFTIDIMDLDKAIKATNDDDGSFCIYICTDGSANLQVAGGEACKIAKGGLVLVPACVEEHVLTPEEQGTRLLKVYLRNLEEEDSYIDESVAESVEE